MWQLVGVLFFAFCVRLILARLFPNLLWPDEIFQTLEQGHRLAFGNGIIPWEFREGIRSWVLPGVFAVIMRSTSWLTVGSGGYIFGIQIVLILLSLAPVALAWTFGKEVGGARGGICAAFFAAIWFELIYFSPKAFSETAAAHLFIFGFLFQRRKSGSPVLAGVLYALAASIRIQLLPAIIVVAIIQCRMSSRRTVQSFGISFLVAILLCGLLDGLTLGAPFQSLWKNIRVQYFQDRSSDWGAAPWYWYAQALFSTWSLAALPVFAFLFIGARRVLPLILFVTTILLTHSVIAHKEMRFLYPAVSVLVPLVGLGIAVVSRHWQRYRIILLLSSCAVISFVLGVQYGPVRDFHEILTMRRPQQTYWVFNAPVLEAFSWISRRGNVCGLGVEGIHWAFTGGYTYLHRDIPLYFLNDVAEAKAHYPLFNAIISVHNIAEDSGFTRTQCLDAVCIYERNGGCGRIIGYDFNALLREWGE